MNRTDAPSVPPTRRSRRLRAPSAVAFAPLVLFAAGACHRAPPPPPPSLDTLAPLWVELALGIGEHDPAYVDAYYGPEATRTKMREAKLDLQHLAWKTSDLIKAVGRIPAGPEGAPGSEEELRRLRHEYLLDQARSAASRIAILQGAKLDFDAESKALYDAVAPHHDEAYFQERIDGIEALLAKVPGIPRSGTLPERIEAFRKKVTIPADRIGPIFDRAIAECRTRTAAHVALPEGESFTVEQVTDKPWSAYNWYQGNLTSVIQVNVSLPMTIDYPVQLGCHEGYPGHHVYNLLLEQKLVRERGWIEYQVYPLFSPQSLIAEGSANFGVEMAFPGDERAAFERDVLFPLAGLDPALAAPYAELKALLEPLAYAQTEAARRHVDGELDAAATAAWLQEYALLSPERAAQRVKFIDTYRSYVINYNLGQDLVRAWVDSRTNAGATPDEAADAKFARRWEVFASLLASPRLPAGLAVEPKAAPAP